ncbi:MAG: acyl carrier protein [Planctomycetes bacterium DG_58]|nr:MAG: acyl carrier protein [Planctomycetes bacterium DG_58]KPL04780.1 MAG: acyl carrier protein [Planctomycetes bacterium SM23_65]
MADREEVLSKVRESLVEALSVDDDEVTMEASLTRDLGAESIDFLDIVFRLEKAFGIKIPRGDLIPAEDLMNNPEFAQDGKFTEVGLSELRKRLPYANLTEFEQNPVVANLADVFTVGMIVGYVESRVSANQ